MCIGSGAETLFNIRKDMLKNDWRCRVMYNNNCDNDYMPTKKKKVGKKLYIDEKTYNKILEDVNDNLIRITGKHYKVFDNLNEFDVYNILGSLKKNEIRISKGKNLLKYA